MAPTEINKFFNNLQKAKKEEEVKNAYAKFFNLDYDTSDAHDLYTTRVLFEFKADKNFENLKTRSAIIAQTLYYVRRLKYGGFIEKPIPPMLCLADVNEAILTETSQWKDFYDDVKVDVVGYPDYLHYVDKDQKYVQSWWKWSGKSKKTGEIINIDYVQFDKFDAAGKIISESIYGDFSKMVKK